MERIDAPNDDHRAEDVDCECVIDEATKGGHIGEDPSRLREKIDHPQPARRGLSGRPGSRPPASPGSRPPPSNGS